VCVYNNLSKNKFIENIEKNLLKFKQKRYIFLNQLQKAKQQII